MMHLRSRLVVLFTLLAAPTAFVVAPAAAAPPAAPTQVWERQLGGLVRESSPLAVDLNGGTTDIVIGAHDGQVYGLDGNNGGNVGGWPQATGTGIDSSASAADTDGDGRDELFIGSGTPEAPQAGSLNSFEHTGARRWQARLGDEAAPNGAAVFATPALGDVNSNGVTDVNVGTLGLRSVWSLNQGNGINPGFPYYADDSIFSSPALFDVNRDGQADIVIGGDSSPGGPVNHLGGMVRAINGANGSLIWEFRTNEIVRSSPSIGDIDGDGAPEIVFGTGNFWNGTDENNLFALNLGGGLKWSRDLDGQTLAAPALADIDGNGVLDIAVGTWADPGGRVYALRGSDGANLPSFGGPKTDPLHSNVIAQISTADFDADGGQDLVVPGSAGMVVYSGKTGAKLFTFAEAGAENTSFQSSPLIEDLDGDSRLDIVVAGTKDPGGARLGFVYRYEMPQTQPTLGKMGWHQWRANDRRTGVAPGTPEIGGPPPNLCGPGVTGYWEVARDGGIFAWCKGFFGSTGGTPLNRPIVGMESTPDGNGYWLVASDGGIFAFGNAGFFGSTGGIPLVQPIVGMARTPSGRGYFLVAADGGIFAFGDAGFAGSTGGMPLARPIVGMSVDPDGRGYWLVASDGGLFAFEAPFFGSTGGMPLNRPIVGMESTPDGRGYQLVASDGGIFAFGNAPFFGSTGGMALNRPIVGMARTPTGRGYYLVASDGGIFAYGDARFAGSTGGFPINQPVVGMAVAGT